MTEFYRMQHWILTMLVMVIALCIVLQTLVISYSIRRLYTGWVRRVENGLECAVLAVLFSFAALFAQVQYALFCGFLEPGGYSLFRQVIVLLTTVLGIAAAMGTEMIWPFFVIGGTAVLLPWTEIITGALYPVFVLASILFFLIRSVHICLMRRKELYTQLSSISVKEAIDTMHTGMLFFRPNGDILLCNHRMDKIARQMTGQTLRNGKEFQEFLECGALFDGCVRETLGQQQVFRLSDSTVWSISSHNIQMKYRTFVLLTADDVTERWDAMTFLAGQNQALKKRGEELRHTIDHLHAICEAEEIARSKGRVHDILGQHISLLFRSLRDNQQQDESIIIDFIHNLPMALRENQAASPGERLETLKETFLGMGVSVEIQGELPENVEVADSFSEIAVECVTNAVRHGYATCIRFHFFQNNCWRMTVTDNGIPPTGFIREGGGITGIRRRVNRLGGTMELRTFPRFNIQIFIPKEDIQV